MAHEEQKPLFEPSYYTIGYEGLSINDFFEIIMGRKIRIVIDIRAKPYSYNESWRKPNLAAAVQARGLQYIHVQELGNPYKDEAQWRDQYRKYIIDRRLVESAESLLKRLTGPVVFLCYCGDVKNCHRGVLTQEIARMGITGMHLQPRSKF